VSIPGFSMELCGGTHVRNTSEIGVFRVVAESGVAAGVRRIEAVTARGAYELGRQRERLLQQVADVLKAPAEQLPRRVGALVEERRALERKLDDALRGGGGGSQVQTLIGGAHVHAGARIIASHVDVGDMRALQALGDALREQMQSGVAVLAASTEGKHTLLVVVTDDMRDRGVRADTVIKEIAAIAGGRGGGKQHMAQAGVPDATRIPDALAAVPGVVSQLLGSAA
jgi:alanyl-tRNA synthetase